MLENIIKIKIIKINVNTKDSTMLADEIIKLYTLLCSIKKANVQIANYLFKDVRKQDDDTITENILNCLCKSHSQSVDNENKNELIFRINLLKFIDIQFKVIVSI